MVFWEGFMHAQLKWELNQAIGIHGENWLGLKWYCELVFRDAILNLKWEPVDICDEIRDENWLGLKWYFEKLLGMQFSFEARSRWYLWWELTSFEVIFWEALRDAILIWSENRWYPWWGLGLLEECYFEKFLGINFQFEVRTVGIHNENWLDLKANHFSFTFVIFVKHGYLLI
jgi:hypothetical protein